ncbi:MarR family transcriptional regulator [Halobacterium litoreum]|uniref:MarR family transcriptional regulator n=1 Tax=Halobacterium litoreum TaxID=2039234 RepID=A0ABD5NEA5_9EURY|nr:helix-turn-helix domain-containing protein [Halobacterium litoreum]UHH13472.1 MarR family transcriptional regulator [Halobacterium litoreum]
MREPYTNEDHHWNIRVAHDEILRRLVELDKPWWDRGVLAFLHHEKKMSQAEIGRAFGITQQSVQQAMDELEITVRTGREKSTAVGRNQKLLADFEEEDPAGLEDFI